MKIIRDSLVEVFETWHDPGDYPNRLAAGPLPDETVMAGWDGEIEVELDGDDVMTLINGGPALLFAPLASRPAVWQATRAEGSVKVTLAAALKED